MRRFQLLTLLILLFYEPGRRSRGRVDPQEARPDAVRFMRAVQSSERPCEVSKRSLLRSSGRRGRLRHQDGCRDTRRVNSRQGRRKFLTSVATLTIGSYAINANNFLAWSTRRNWLLRVIIHNPGAPLCEHPIPGPTWIGTHTTRWSLILCCC